MPAQIDVFKCLVCLNNRPKPKHIPFTAIEDKGKTRNLYIAEVEKSNV